MDDLLQEGIKAYRAGKRDEARKIFITVVKQSPDSESSWGWMYQVSSNDQERIYCLKQILRINPKSEKANQLLAKLTTSSFPLESPVTPPQVAKPQLISEQKPRSLPTQTRKPVTPQKSFDKKQLGIVAIVLLCIVCLCIGVVSYGGNGGNASGGDTNEGDTSAWVPSGFKQWDNETAFRFVDGVACSYSTGKCSHVEVFTRYGCPTSLYVEVAFKDSNGTQIDWGNDTATSLSPGTKAMLEFVSFENSATKTTITQIKCY